MAFFPPSIGMILKICAILIVCTFTYVFLLPLPLSFLGYYPDGVGWDVAQKIVDANGEASDCRKIIHLISHPFSPTEGEQRSSCIYTYAKLTKDPSACELLMPSSYGMSCIGGARTVPQPCFLKPDLSVGGNGIRASLKECVSGSNDIKNNACCIISRVSSIIGQDDCSTLNGNPEMHDQCLNELAFKKKDPSFCQNILNDNTRSACEVHAKALRENPSICTGCVAPVSLEEAKKLP